MVKSKKQCPHCAETFSKSKSRKNHMNNVGHGWLCPELGCGDERWASKLDLKEHCRAYHSIDAEPVRQRQMQVEQAPGTGTPVTAPDHIPAAPAFKPSTQEDVLLAPEPVECDLCKEKTLDLSRHISIVHKTCAICQTRCAHIPTHYKYSHPSLYCEECKTPFDSSEAVQVHACHGNKACSVTIDKESIYSLEATKKIAHREPEPLANVYSNHTDHSDTSPNCLMITLPAVPDDKDDGEAIVTIPAPTFVDVLIAHFVHEFRNKYGKDLIDDTRAIERLRTASQRVQTALLTSPWTSIELNRLFDGITFRSVVERTEFDVVQVPHTCTSHPGLADDLSQDSHIACQATANITGIGLTEDKNTSDTYGNSVAPSPEVPVTNIDDWESSSDSSEVFDILSDAEVLEIEGMTNDSTGQLPSCVTIAAKEDAERTLSSISTIFAAADTPDSDVPGSKENISTFNSQASSATNAYRLDCEMCSRMASQPTRTICGHLFCRGCIIVELTSNLRCPVCRTNILVHV